MNLKLTSPIAIAAISLSLSCMAQSPDSTAAMPSDNNVTQAQLVPAQATLKQNLDAKKLQPGATFQAVLTDKSQLANGPRLPAGTILIGQVVSDETQPDGSSRLALRFTTAQMKNGQSVPIRATIVNFRQPSDANGSDFYPGELPAGWETDPGYRVDALEVVSGVDMHSALNGSDSAVFVAHPNKNVKLRAGSELILALEAQPAADSASGQ